MLKSLFDGGLSAGKSAIEKASVEGIDHALCMRNRHAKFIANFLKPNSNDKRSKAQKIFDMTSNFVLLDSTDEGLGYLKSILDGCEDLLSEEDKREIFKAASMLKSRGMQPGYNKAEHRELCGINKFGFVLSPEQYAKNLKWNVERVNFDGKMKPGGRLENLYKQSLKLRSDNDLDKLIQLILNSLGDKTGRAKDELLVSTAGCLYKVMTNEKFHLNSTQQDIENHLALWHRRNGRLKGKLLPAERVIAMKEWDEIKRKPTVNGLVGMKFAAEKYALENWVKGQRAYEFSYSDML